MKEKSTLKQEAWTTKENLDNQTIINLEIVVYDKS